MAYTLGFHHVVLTVSDFRRSTDFYARAFKLRKLSVDDNVQCLTDDRVLLCLQLAPHAPLSDDRFDEKRIGLDHLAFAVATREDLEDMVERLKRRGVDTAGIEFDPDGQSEYVCFRDPDNIQVEVYVTEVN